MLLSNFTQQTCESDAFFQSREIVLKYIKEQLANVQLI